MTALELVLQAIGWLIFGFVLGSSAMWSHLRAFKRPAKPSSSHTERLEPSSHGDGPDTPSWARVEDALAQVQTHVDAMHEANTPINVPLLRAGQGDVIRVVPLDAIQEVRLRAYASPRVPMFTHWAPRKHSIAMDNGAWQAWCGRCDAHGTAEHRYGGFSECVRWLTAHCMDAHRDTRA